MPFASVTGPESPPDSDSEASEHGALDRQQDTAARKKPSVEREDWMTKAMPKATPGAAQEGADQLKEEPAKKVTLQSCAQPEAYAHCVGCIFPRLASFRLL